MVEGESSGVMSVDIDDLAISMTEKIYYYYSVEENGIHKNGKSSCFIPKIKKDIRMLDVAAYEPSCLSVGPYHHGNPCLQTVQKKKWSCLTYILFMNQNVKLYDYLNKISELETKVRNCYLDEMTMDSTEFLQMLLLDGCFILVHLRGLDGIIPCYQVHGDDNQSDETQGDKEKNNKATSSEVTIDQYDVKCASTCMGQLEHIETTSTGKDATPAHVTVDSELEQKGQEKDARWYNNYAYHDLFLLENQIPFFVVKAIYELFAGIQDSNRLTDNIAKFIESFIYMYPNAIHEAERPKNFHHLLHLCHMYLSPSEQREQHHPVIAPEYFQGILSFGRRYFKLVKHQEQKEQGLMFHNTSNSRCNGKLSRWKRALQYHEAGIEFRRRELHDRSPHSLLDITFRSGVLEVPFLFVDDITGSRFRNLIAFEETSPHLGNNFTAYAAFIAQLISSPKDVSLLVKRGIIVHQMRSDEDVSVVFSRLLKGIDFDRHSSHYLRATCIALEEHYQNRINRWMAWLWQNHFSNPWLILAVLAAIIVIVCTILQLLFALLAYVNPATDDSTT